MVATAPIPESLEPSGIFPVTWPFELERPSMEPLQADAVVAGVLSGDIERYQELVEAYQRDVWRVVAGRGYSQDTARELVQQTFVEGYCHLARYQPGRDFRVWLQGIARNLVRKELRTWAHRSRHRESYRAHLETLIQEEQDAEGDPRLEALATCRESLDAESRSVIDAFYHEGRSLEAIAARLGRSLVAAKQLLWRIRGQLRHCVELRMRHP